jgi:Chitin binding Peritrophin-A domain
MLIIIALIIGIMRQIVPAKIMIVSFLLIAIGESFFINFLSFIATPISSGICEYQFGLYEDSPECSTTYVKCEYGIPNQLPCQKGLVYDDRIKGCNWPDLLLDKCNPEAVVGFKCPAKVDPRSQAARFWPFPRFASNY